MSSSQHEIIVSSRVRLARNYFDLPFSTVEQPEKANLCIERAKEALACEGLNESNHSYLFNSLQKMSKHEKTSLMEQHLISRDLLIGNPYSAVLIRDDQAVSVMINEEDHLRIQALLKGMNLESALEIAFQAEDKLQRVCDFSFDSQLGYLTACPTNTGTGMRASLMLHLPLLTRCKQMGTVTQSVAKLGLTIRGIYGEGSDAQGDLYQVSNQVTLGRTEKEIIEAVIAVGNQLIDMESALRNRALSETYFDLKDQIFRSYGTLRYAMQMNATEFMQHWSHLRLGISLKLLSVAMDKADELLTIAQDAHAELFIANGHPSLTTDQARAEIIRTNLNPTLREV